MLLNGSFKYTSVVIFFNVYFNVIVKDFYCHTQCRRADLFFIIISGLN